MLSGVVFFVCSCVVFSVAIWVGGSMVSCGFSCVDVHKCLVHNTPQQATKQDSCEEGRRCPRTSEGQHVEDLFVRR